MFCEQCWYDLSGLIERRCPECGLDFDPNETEAFAIECEVRQRQVSRMCAAFSLYGVAAIAVLYVIWAAGTLALGHRPRPGLDDPRSIGAWIEVLGTMFMLAVSGLPVAMVLNLLALAIYLANQVELRRWPAWTSLRLPCGAIGVWIFCIVVLAWDPMGAADWILG